MAARHGHSRKGAKTPEYRAWRSIIDRCCYPSHKSWPDYGARGIIVCAEWRVSFESFLAYVGAKPSRAHSIDRIDTYGNYEPGNVRWALRSEQAANTRRNRFVRLHGERMCLTEAARRLGVSHEAVRQRLRYGTGWKVGLAEEPSRPVRNDSSAD